jgi:hypothetical protein
MHIAQANQEPVSQTWHRTTELYKKDLNNTKGHLWSLFYDTSINPQANVHNKTHPLRAGPVLLATPRAFSIASIRFFSASAIVSCLRLSSLAT